jgi:hypothetical protein
MMCFATTLVMMDKRGRICDALLDTICVRQNLRHPVDAQRIIGRLEAQIATLRAGETPLRHGCRGLFLQPERWDPEIPQS